MSLSDPHARARLRIELRNTGLLPEAQEAELEAHLNECAACRESAVVDEGESPTRLEFADGHIPPGMLARWPKVMQSVQGLERKLLVEHLQSCEMCHADLRLAGHEAFQDHPVRVIPLSPGLRRRFWMQGALTGAVLTAAAGAVLLWPSPGTIESESLPWVVPGTQRGTAPSVEVNTATARVVLAVPVPPDLPPDPAVRVMIRDPGGRVLLDQAVDDRLLASPTMMFVLSGSPPLIEGLYTVEILTASSPDPEVSSFRIRILEP